MNPTTFEELLARTVKINSDFFRLHGNHIDPDITRERVVAGAKTFPDPIVCDKIATWEGEGSTRPDGWSTEILHRNILVLMRASEERTAAAAATSKGTEDASAKRAQGADEVCEFNGFCFKDFCPAIHTGI